MEVIKILLLPNSKKNQEKEPQEFDLYSHRLESSIVNTLQVTENFVFNNYEYCAKLQCDNPQIITNFQFYLNNTLLTTKYDPNDGNIVFCDEHYGTKPFLECYGYVQLTVMFSVEEKRFHYDTNYIPVMVRKGKQNDSVQRMTEYVYKHNESLLFSNHQLPRNIAGIKENSRKTVESRILLLKEISRTFEMNYPYFQANSRFRIIQTEHVDRFEKLQHISISTIQYISQHPAELKQTNISAGIKVGNRTYLPDRTLITNNVQTFDIYENRQVIGFLETLLGEINRMQREIKELIERVPTSPIEHGDYVVSAYFIFANTVEVLNSMFADLDTLKNRFMSLLSAYSKIFKINSDRVSSVPRPTPIFLSIPQYRQLYECINKWFKMGVVNLIEERFMLSFLKISSLYEIFILLKMINYINDSGFTFQDASKIHYHFSHKVRYENTTCNNKYIFQREETVITLYYQPVIYDVDRSEKTGIGLYRNTSISFPRWLGDDNTGSYYTPDYLIKIEIPGKYTRYIIADAKFMTTVNVKKFQVAALAYKYLFSISPINSTDKIVALYVINGQADEDMDSVTDIYDHSLAPGSITPRAEIMTITENSESAEETHFRLFKDTIGQHF